MGVVSQLCGSVELPRMVKVRQTFDREEVPAEQIPEVIRKELEKHRDKFIPGMGGALGSVLAAAGIGDVLVSVIETVHIHPVLFAWLVAVVLKAAQGSGTLSMITAISLLAPSVGSLNVQPIFIALAAFSGSMCVSIVNDSGFWITTKIARLTTLGGFKICSLMCFIISIVSLILIMAASFVF